MATSIFQSSLIHSSLSDIKEQWRRRWCSASSSWRWSGPSSHWTPPSRASRWRSSRRRPRAVSRACADHVSWQERAPLRYERGWTHRVAVQEHRRRQRRDALAPLRVPEGARAAQRERGRQDEARDLQRPLRAPSAAAAAVGRRLDRANGARGAQRALLRCERTVHRPQKHALRLFLSKATATVATDSDEPSHTSEQAYAVKVIRNVIVTIGVNEYIRSAYAQTLVASFITKYPGLAVEYLQALSIQLEPKPGYRWFCVASLMQKLLSCPLDAITVGFPKESGADAPSWCSSSALATCLVLPLNCRKELSRGIQHANNLLIYSTPGVMEVALRRNVRAFPEVIK